MKYIFRGLVLFEYNPETKQIEAPMHDAIDTLANFNHCKFIPDDYVQLADFFNTAYAHATDFPNVDLQDIVVN